MTIGFNSKQQKQRNRDRDRGGEANKGFDPRRSSETAMKCLPEKTKKIVRKSKKNIK